MIHSTWVSIIGGWYKLPAVRRSAATLVYLMQLNNIPVRIAHKQLFGPRASDAGQGPERCSAPLQFRFRRTNIFNRQGNMRTCWVLSLTFSHPGRLRSANQVNLSHIAHVDPEARHVTDIGPLFVRAQAKQTLIKVQVRLKISLVSFDAHGWMMYFDNAYRHRVPLC
jgi:hypothetical protein